MKRQKFVTTKMKYLLMGVLIGITMMTSAIVFANTNVSALLNKQVKFFFNGEERALPEGYEVLTYKGRTYTPARFVAEELGAEVIWDEVTSSIFIQYEEEQEEEETPEIPDDETEEDVEEEVEKEEIDYKDFKKLPIVKRAYDAEVSISVVSLENNHTTVYLEIEGRTNVPVQLNRKETTMKVDGVTYDQNDQSRIVDPVDVRWYNDIHEDESVAGWVKFPAIDEDTKYMTINLEVFRNDGSNETTEFEFDIAL